ncbi:hypothetical protein DB44_AP00260 [Candidatus Protochlamydia amoebophila]|uniref:Uncharacterized protein n=1 Tax=Candidatus Protochlamydia amoebophila TaxID=362787 RepID=A0A0C1K4C0_9BACT|nr:hypothetical protein DB44_AP00260 [Candidatus Protochlamydia amoebophila]
MLNLVKVTVKAAFIELISVSFNLYVLRNDFFKTEQPNEITLNKFFLNFFAKDDLN